MRVPSVKRYAWMTRAKYHELKKTEKKAHAMLVQITKINARKELVKGYYRMASVLKRLPRVKLSQENKDRMLSAYARNDVKRSIERVLDSGIEKAVKIAIRPVLAYVAGSFKDVGLNVPVNKAFENLESRLLRKLKTKNFRKIEKVENRTGFNLSPSVWNAVDGFSDRILAIIEAELEAGTDPVTIARMIEEYLAEGNPEKILGRWGRLEIGTPEYRQRLGTSGADYRTQRLVRTEMYHAIRTADIEVGANNPATTGMYEWILSPSHIDWNCDCPERASGGPYTKTEIDALSASAHPNCFCLVNPIMLSHDEFIKDLKDFADGKDTHGAGRIGSWFDAQGIDSVA